MSAQAAILIAYDGSVAARAAVERAGALFAPRRTIVLTVWEPGLGNFMLASDPTGVGTTMLPYDPSLGRELDRAGEEHARDIAADGVALASTVGLQAEGLAVGDGFDTADTILSQADEQGVGAIVLGSRGLTGLKSKLNGSTSRKVLERSNLPVMVIRHPEDHE